jgi:hypothetical protein
MPLKAIHWILLGLGALILFIFSLLFLGLLVYEIFIRPIPQ